MRTTARHNRWQSAAIKIAKLERELAASEVQRKANEATANEAKMVAVSLASQLKMETLALEVTALTLKLRASERATKRALATAKELAVKSAKVYEGTVAADLKAKEEMQRRAKCEAMLQRNEEEARMALSALVRSREASEVMAQKLATQAGIARTQELGEYGKAFALEFETKFQSLKMALLESQRNLASAVAREDNAKAEIAALQSKLKATQRTDTDAASTPRIVSTNSAFLALADNVASDTAIAGTTMIATTVITIDTTKSTREVQEQEIAIDTESRGRRLVKIYRAT
jgi:hypothetical protein